MKTQELQIHNIHEIIHNLRMESLSPFQTNCKEHENATGKEQKTTENIIYPFHLLRRGGTDRPTHRAAVSQFQPQKYLFKYPLSIP